MASGRANSRARIGKRFMSLEIDILESIPGLLKCLGSVLEFQNNLWGLGTDQEQGCGTGPPGFIGWRAGRLESIPGLIKSLKIPSLMSYHLSCRKLDYIHQTALHYLQGSFYVPYIQYNFISNIIYHSMYHPSLVLLFIPVHTKTIVKRVWEQGTGLWFQNGAVAFKHVLTDLVPDIFNVYTVHIFVNPISLPSQYNLLT